MTKVQQIPNNGLLNTIRLNDTAPDTNVPAPQPAKAVIETGFYPKHILMAKRAEAAAAKKAAALQPKHESKAKMVARPAPMQPRQKQPQIMLKSCTWCGGRVWNGDDIHVRCAEIKARMEPTSHIGRRNATD